MRRAAVLACALTVVMAGCAGRATEARVTPLPTPTPTPLPIAWSLRSDAAQGYAVAVPDVWVAVIRDAPTFEADLRAVGDRGPELGLFFSGAFKKYDQLRLLAADPASLQAGFAANVNVMVSDLGLTSSAPTLDDVAAAKAKRLLATPDAAGATRRTDRLAGVPAVRFEYPLTANGAPVLVRTLVAVVDRGGRRYLFDLTMGAPQDAAPALFATEQRLFRLFQPSGGSPRKAPSPSPSPSSADSQQGTAG